MRVKIYSYDSGYQHKSFPEIVEVSDFNVDDISGQIILLCALSNGYFVSEMRFTIYDVPGILDDVYKTLLVTGYADLTSFGNFMFNQED